MSETNNAAQEVVSPATELNSKLEGLESPKFKDQEVKFTFKIPKGTPRQDSEGKDIPEDNLRRAPVILTLPVLTFDGLVHELMQENAKINNFILDVINEQIISAARDQVTDESKPVNRQNELDISKLTLEYLANMPKSERTGSGISKETWEEFEADYIAIMPKLTDRPKEKIEKSAKLFVSRLAPVKGNKTVLKFLQGQLALWAGHTTKSEDLIEVFQFLDSKISTLLSADDADLLSSLM